MYERVSFMAVPLARDRDSQTLVFIIANFDKMWASVSQAICQSRKLPDRPLTPCATIIKKSLVKSV